MDLRHFLAMTGAEFALCPEKPENIAWMACHFSTYGAGLSNRPQDLPPGSMLILNDRIPVCGHDPLRVAEELAQTAETLECDCILLDFQRCACDETAAVVDAVLQAAPVPVGVSDMYAAEHSCPVFLSPPALTVPLADHIAPWQGREIWLETALETSRFTLTKEGCSVFPLPHAPWDKKMFQDDILHCTYCIDIADDSVVFTLWRTQQDIDALLRQAADLGILKAVGLYQQLKP